MNNCSQRRRQDQRSFAILRTSGDLGGNSRGGSALLKKGVDGPIMKELYKIRKKTMLDSNQFNYSYYSPVTTVEKIVHLKVKILVSPILCLEYLVK